MKLARWFVRLRFLVNNKAASLMTEWLVHLRVLGVNHDSQKFGDYQQKMSELEQKIDQLLHDLHGLTIDERQATVLEQLIQMVNKQGKVTFTRTDHEKIENSLSSPRTEDDRGQETLSFTANRLIETLVTRGVYQNQDFIQRKSQKRSFFKGRVGEKIRNLRVRRSISRPFSQFRMTHKKSGKRTGKMMNLPEVNIQIPEKLKTDRHCIAILGSGLDKQGNLGTIAIKRLEVAEKLACKYSKSKIICSGGAPKNGVTEAQAMANWLIRQGISPDRILKEDQSTDTIENAMNTLKLMHNKGLRNVTVVTSVSHMRRALNDFLEANHLLKQTLGKSVNKITHLAYPDRDPRKPLTVEEKKHVWWDLLRMHGAWKYPDQFCSEAENIGNGKIQVFYHPDSRQSR